MATKDFEIQQLLKAYRKGSSPTRSSKQMKELGAATEGWMSPMCWHSGAMLQGSAQMLQKTPQSQTMTFTIPANLATTTRTPTKGPDHLRHRWLCDARVSARNKRSGGDMLMIPAGSPHTLRTAVSRSLVLHLAPQRRSKAVCSQR